MQFEISLDKADEIILLFLRENGFSEHAKIRRYVDKNKQETSISDVYIEDNLSCYSDKPKSLTRISNYNKLLREILQLQGNPVSEVNTKVTSSKISFVISAIPNKSHKRGR